MDVLFFIGVVLLVPLFQWPISIMSDKALQAMVILWFGYGVMATLAWCLYPSKTEPFTKIKTPDKTIYSNGSTNIIIFCEDGYWRFSAQTRYETMSIKATSREYVEKQAEWFITR